MIANDRPRFRTAYTLLTTAIDEGQFDESRRLPSIITLARMAGVSKSTMWDVITALKKKGRLLGAPGHRPRLPGSVLQPQPRVTARLDPRRSKSYFLQEQLRREILDGQHATARPLPPSKQLANRFGVCQSTLRVGLSALVRESILVRRKNLYYPLSIDARSVHGSSRIVLLGWGTNIGHTIAWGYWHQEFLKLLEVECAAANCALDVICFARNSTGVLEFFDGRNLPNSKPIPFAKNPNVLGYIYESVGKESFEDELLTTLAGWGAPVGILDEIGSWPSRAFLKRHPNLRIFRNTVTDLPAQQVARFVLGLGHQTAIFISPCHSSEYSLRRYEGLSLAFSTVEGTRLVPVTSIEDGDYTAQGAQRAGLDSLMTFYDNWRRNIPPNYARPLHRHFTMIPPLLTTSRLYEDIDRLIERALKIRDATVWIAVNDDCAHYLLDALQERNIAVPQRISIISFDDLPDALTLGITSYNFNQSAMGLAMLRFITNPGLYPVRRPVIEIQGQIIPRRTTGKVSVLVDK